MRTIVNPGKTAAEPTFARTIREIITALVGSLPAAELQYRLSLRDAPRRQRLNRLTWRSTTAPSGPRTSPAALRTQRGSRSPATRSRRSAERSSGSREHRSSGAPSRSMGCFACQTFWAGVAGFAVARGIADLTGCFFTAAASSGAGVLLSLADSTGQNKIPSGSNRVACTSWGN